MQASPPTPGATGVTILPDAGRTDMLARAGLSGSAHWTGVERRPRHSDDLTEADPWGDTGWDDPDEAERELEELGFVIDGGWSPATIKGSRGNTGGLTSHAVNQYAVLAPGEYVNTRVLQERFEEALGFSFDQVRSVCRQGRMTDAQRELRGRIDVRLLELDRGGANMAWLGRLLGFEITPDGHCRGVENAVARARAAEAVAT